MKLSAMEGENSSYKFIAGRDRAIIKKYLLCIYHIFSEKSNEALVLTILAKGHNKHEKLSARSSPRS